MNLNLKIMSSNFYCSIRRYSTTWEEIRIPMPWGHIAGKWWGSRNKQPILSSHGWQDNCGTYDRLIPMLPSNISFLTYDFPGHGLSSKLPHGMFYHNIDGAILIRSIVKYFNWSKVSLMGHSLGSGINYVYAMLFPENVNYLICLDLLKPHIPNNLINKISVGIDKFLKYDQLNSINSEPPSYTFEELEQMVHLGSQKQIDVNMAKYILQRNVSPSLKDNSRFYLTRDPRLKTYNLMNWSQSTILNNVHRLAFPICLCLASDTTSFENVKNAHEVIEALRKVNKNFEVHRVQGSHHVHLNNPERVATIINSFLMRHNVSDTGLDNKP